MLAVAEATLFGAAAAVSTLIGTVLAVLGHRAGRKAAQAQAEADLHEQLLTARREAEQLSAELHELRMRDAERPG